MVNKLTTDKGLPLYFIGPPQAQGPLPALIYFSVSGEESLTLAPYNHVPERLSNEMMRTFSITLPGHEQGMDKFKAMKYWADQIKAGSYLLEEFVEKVDTAIHWLIDNHLVDPNHIALSGLSRGGLIAGLVAAKNTHVKTLVGFAPVVTLSVLEDFADFRENHRLMDRMEHISLASQVERLTHLRTIRFYIATLDEKVDTDSCYHFIRKMTEKAHEKRAKHCHISLVLSSPIGHKGHGTPTRIFDEGAMIIKQQLIG